MIKNNRVAVIIPYFQREQGILRRSVQSVLRQNGVPRPYIIIVDDASPVPADLELTDLMHEYARDVTVIRQSNGGPGAARNTGIEAVPDQYELVAFLDSDDEWHQDHLRIALEAFCSGCDFFFSDHLDYSGMTTRLGRAQMRGTFRLDVHPLVQPGSSVRWFSGDFVDQLIRDFVVGTPTVVVRRSVLGPHRFPAEFRRAGEDHLLWLKIAVGGAKVAFSEQIACTLGIGVNIYEASVFGTAGGLERTVDYDGLLTQMRKLYARTKGQKRLLSSRIVVARRDFIRNLLHDIARRRFPSASLVWRQLRQDPWTLVVLIPESIHIAMERKKRSLKESHTGMTQP
ncbi:MAG: glycosyltransferase family 2 protein [Deltaproteobacteria bacterium]|nr:glycosyltransferase family 2 protein [Deltaproteobacteria bacterium]